MIYWQNIKGVNSQSPQQKFRITHSVGFLNVQSCVKMSPQFKLTYTESCIVQFDFCDQGLLINLGCITFANFMKFLKTSTIKKLLIAYLSISQSEGMFVFQILVSAYMLINVMLMKNIAQNAQIKFVSCFLHQFNHLLSWCCQFNLLDMLNSINFYKKFILLVF